MDKLAKFIIFSNLWISLAAAGLTLNTYFLINQNINWNVIHLVFLATFSVYNFQRLIKHYYQNKNHSKRHLWIYNNSIILTILVIISSLTSLFLFFESFSIPSFIILIPFIAVSILYATPIFSKNRALRDYPFIKIFLIAITWAASSVLLPAIELDLFFNSKLITLFIINFLFIIAITIPFDIRDLKVDDLDTKTIPQVFGINGSILLSLALIIACCVLAHSYFHRSGQNIHLEVSLVCTFIILFFYKKEMPELYYSGILDGTILLFPISNILIRMLDYDLVI